MVKRRCERTACSRLRRSTLDSEGETEWSFLEEPLPSRLEAGAQGRRRGGQSEPGNNEGVLSVRTSGALRVFANNGDRCDDDALAAVGGAHARGRCVPMRAVRGGRLRTPDLTRQAAALPNCQRQHD